MLPTHSPPSIQQPDYCRSKYGVEAHEPPLHKRVAKVSAERTQMLSAKPRWPGMTGITENAFINVKNRPYTITVPVELQDSSTNGVIIAQAGAFGGWVLYMKDGKIHHEYNYFGVERTNIGGPAPLSAGKHVIKYEFVPDAAKPDAGGKSVLYVDGQQVAEGHIPKTQPFMFSSDEGTDVGMDGETAVSNDYKQADNKFTGKILKVTIDTKPSNFSAADEKAVEDAEEEAAAIIE